MKTRTPSKKFGIVIVIEIFIFAALAIGLSKIIFSNQWIKSTAEVKQIVGSVQKMDMKNGQISQIRLDQSIGNNQRIISESNSYAFFELLDGEAVLEIEPFTSVVLNIDHSRGEPTLLVTLEVGQIRVRGGQGKLFVHTPAGTATTSSSDGAMSIEVQLNLQATVYACLQGSCQVSNQSGTSEINSGQSVNYSSSNSAALLESDLIRDRDTAQSDTDSVKVADQNISEVVTINNNETEPIILAEQPTQETPTISVTPPSAVAVQVEEVMPTAVQATPIPPTESPIPEVLPTEESQPTVEIQPTTAALTVTQPSFATNESPDDEMVAVQPTIIPEARVGLTEVGSINWEMVQFGNPSSLNLVPEGLNSSLQYDVDTHVISGTMGCNSYRGEAEFLNNIIMVVKPPSAFSKNTCLEHVMNYESLFHTMMGQMISYEVNGDFLTITTSLDWVMIFEQRVPSQNSTTTRPNVDSPPPKLPTSNTYYVDSANGSNGNTGMEDAPWRTIQYAANVLPEDKTVIVLEGHYPERVTITRPNLSFQASGEVLMEGFSIKANYTTISGFTVASLVDDIPEGIGIDVPNAGYCLIENNRFLYNTWGGLRLDTSSHDCVVRNNTFSRNALYAAEVMGQNHLIVNNDVSHSIQHHPCSSSTASWLDADAFRFHGSGHIFRNNNIHDMSYGGAGYDQAECSLENLSDLSLDFVSDSHTDCFQTYGGERIAGHDILFEGNRCDLPTADQWDGAAAKAFQATGNAYNLTFRNNLVVADLLSFFADGCHDINIFNNTFIGSGATHSQGLQFENCAGNIQIKNNVFVNQANGIGHIWQEDNTPVNAGNNCVYLEGGSPPRPADPGDLWGVDPRLDSSFRLTGNSPCIDAGIDLGVSTDFDNRSRPQGDGPDIGAFEYPAP